MRSSCIRLRIRGVKGPKSLKPYEALSQLEQLEKMYKEDWVNLSSKLAMFIKQTLRLLISCNNKIKETLQPLNLACNKCKKTKNVVEDILMEIDTENIESFGPVSIEYVLNRHINSQDSFQCNHDLEVQSLDQKGRLAIFSFSKPLNFDIPERILLWGKIWKYKAHIAESVQTQENITYFEYVRKIFFQSAVVKCLHICLISV